MELEIHIVEGKVAPRYSASVTKLDPINAVITEKGMESGLPLVDFQMTDEKGEQYFFMISGTLLIMLADAIKGVTLRNDETKEH